MRGLTPGLGGGLRGAEVSATSHPRPLQTRPRSLSGACPRIPFSAQARTALEVSVFRARRLPTPAAQGPLNILRA